MRFLLRGAAMAAGLLISTSGAFAGSPPSCYFHLPETVKTIAYGVYEGPRKPFRDINGKRMGMVTVKVPAGDDPVLLVLSSYSSVYWTLEFEPKARLAGVLVLGYEPQAVANIPQNVPAGFSTNENGVGTDCPKPVHAYQERDEDYWRLVEAVDATFGRRVDEFYGNYAAACLPKGCTPPAEPQSENLWQWFFNKPEKPAKGPAPPPVRTSSGDVVGNS